MSAVQELMAFGAAVQAAGLLSSTCGNASLRTAPDELLITASGSALGSLRPEQTCRVSLREGRLLEGERPSMELDFHRRAYLARPELGAVLHGQSRYATLLACMQRPPASLDLIPEVPAYVGRHADIPWALPGSPELAARVGEALADPEVGVVQMRNHGQVVVGSDWRQALRRATFFEFACWLASQGQALHHIPAADAERLRGYGKGS